MILFLYLLQLSESADKVAAVTVEPWFEQLTEIESVKLNKMKRRIQK